GLVPRRGNTVLSVVVHFLESAQEIVFPCLLPILQGFQYFFYKGFKGSSDFLEGVHQGGGMAGV
ncbi:hypothetical protein, partial [Gorillibacterium sp. sgz5001074]|uniref:hypothetical protein n=1 Tax=Gorillibacterium sp. sgz5001074 TaxID=3446695 RepID=UPI003F67A0C0